MHNETRFRATENQNPARYQELVQTARENIQERFRLYQQLEKGAAPAALAK